ncbi:MAG: hypothetical protein J6I85_07190 [Clostridia bacterium]|nr:hypothetical protein [Clostridia bacterium]
MKILFAVSNDTISETIVKRYQRDYKEIVTSKNVYYFNAIVKEIQKDKSYDRIIISEELEAFTNTQYQQIDKFIFGKLESISDEASNFKGDDKIPIILITSDRRTKGEEMLEKLYSIGIYNAVLGNDRSTDEVCKLINKPRTAREAIDYYNIQTDDNEYKSYRENDVSEQEIQNILAHYKKLGKNEEKYVTSFENIVSQYNDAQLRIISKFLPLNVRAVLEEQSPKYQQIMSYNNSVTDKIRRPKNNVQPDLGPSGKLLRTEKTDNLPKDPIIIPSAVDTQNVKRLTRKHDPEVKRNTTEINAMQKANMNKVNEIKNSESKIDMSENNNNNQNNPIDEINNIVEDMNLDNVQEVKRGRGRPKKILTPEEITEQEQAQANPKRGRGRPRKNPVVQEEDDSNIDNVLSELEELNNTQSSSVADTNNNDAILPGFEDETNFNNDYNSSYSSNGNAYDPFADFEDINNTDNNNDTVLPGFEEEISNNDYYNNDNNSNDNTYDPFADFEDINNTDNNNDTVLPGFEDETNFNNDYHNNSVNNDNTYNPFDAFENSNNNDNTYNPFDAFENVNNIDNDNSSVLPGFEEETNIENDYNNNNSNNDNTYNPFDTFENVNNTDTDNSSVLPGFEEDTSYDNNYNNNKSMDNQKTFDEFENVNNTDNNNSNDDYSYNQYNVQQHDNYSSNIDILRMLRDNQKIVAFVGTSKNGTSFIVNNLAEYASSIGINVAILDTTKNKNSYYIYTKNEEDLIKIAENCLNNLVQGQAKGVKANSNLTVYTSLPEDRENLNYVEKILEPIVRSHDLILIDCDYDTPYEYFHYAQEICLVQSLDILTIQPLTAFLRELKAHNVLDENKLKIILNKYVKVRGISDKTIIGGMSKYTDPAQSFMTSLFDINNAVKNSMTIQFEQDIYTRYLESVIDCDVSIKGYSKTFMQKLKDLCNWVYRTNPGGNTYRPPVAPTYNNNTFTPSMNETLNQMKKKY